MKLNITKLSKISKGFNKQHTELKDIILFGSSVRGKLKPNDIDILLLFKEKIDVNIEYEFKKQVSKLFKNISLISKTEKTVLDESFNAREAILFEGYSLIKKEKIAQQNGFSPQGMFIYSTKNLKNVEKTKFYYALNGRRKEKGMLNELNAIKLSDNILSVPLDKIEETKEFLERQNIEFKFIPCLIPIRLAKRHIIGKVS